MKVEVAPPFSDSLPQRPALTSLFRYSPGLILIAIALADMARFADPDIWGHVRFGQAALQQGHLVWTDPYSYTAFGRPWLNHEWLTEVIMGALFNLAGVFGLKLMKLACTAVTLCFIAAAESETGAPILVQLGILLISAVCIAPQIQFRPQAFTFAMLSVLIYMLTRDLYRRRAPLWIAVPMLAIWANLHGGFILGITTLAIYTSVSGAQAIVAGRAMRRTYRLAAITILAILATLATPYGIGAWQAVWHALANPYTRTIIVDWQPLTTQYASQWHIDKLSVIYLQLGVCLIAATIVSFLLAPTSDDLPMLAIAAITSIAAFVSVRNLPAAVIALAVPLARHLPLALRKLSMSLDSNSGPIEPASRFNQAILVAGALMVFVQSDLFSNHLGTKDPYPAAACDFMDTHHLHGNLLSLFGWGEYEIWHLAPRTKVFVDGRYDTVFPPDVLRDYLLFNFNQANGDVVLTKYPTDYVLIPPDNGGRKIMDARRDWCVIYRDDLSLLYARTDSFAAHIPGIPVTGVSTFAVFP